MYGTPMRAVYEFSETRRSGAFKVGDDCIFEGISEPSRQTTASRALNYTMPPPLEESEGGRKLKGSSNFPWLGKTSLVFSRKPLEVS